MKTLIAVLSYIPDKRRGCHNAIREGWGKDVVTAEVDLNFFLPMRRWQNNEIVESASDYPDEIYLDINDAYDRIQYESFEILRWSTQRGYDFTFLACNDTFINIKRLFSSGFEQYDYFGVYYSPSYPRDMIPGEQADFPCNGKIIPNMYLWADGGIGYIVSKKAAELIIAEEPTWMTSDIHHGQILGPHIKTRNILIGRMNDGISEHYPRTPNEPRYAGVCQWQKDMYENKA